MFKRSLLLALTAVAAALPLAPASGDIETITIDATAAARPFPHFWETIFGSGRANLALRESYRRDLDSMRAVTSIQYVRFHAIFHDENGIYDQDAQGRPIYNFSYLDQIYDGLLERNIRPFVELSFMPRKLAADTTPHPFWYKPLPNPPADYGRWSELVYQLAHHMIERYGAAEVRQWYFEVWNEPNIDFWTGNPKRATYFQLYDAAVRGLKRADPHLRAGGPATAQAAWIPEMIAHCSREHVPLDFVSTHVYGNDTAPNVFGTDETIPRSDMVARAVRKVHDQVAQSSRPDLPIYWSEYNASYMTEPDVEDAPFMGPWLANNIRQCDGFATAMSYWTFSDVFEEQGVVKTPFYGGYGLIAAGHIPKASFNAFALLHNLGNERISISSTSALATRKPDGALAIAVWNYWPPEEAGAPRQFRIEVKGVPSDSQASVRIVDARHGSPLALWKQMGSPSWPTREQQRQLIQAGALPEAESRTLSNGALMLDLAPHALAMVEIRAAKGGR